MGACCGKESEAFQGEGRTLGANPTAAPVRTNNARSTIPAKRPSLGEGRTLGSAAPDASKSNSPGAAAAKAAEERQKAAQGKGKLAKQLDAQKSQTQSATLAQSARENVATRDADAATQARNWN